MRQLIRCVSRIRLPSSTRISPPANSALFLYLLPKKFPTYTPPTAMTNVTMPITDTASAIG